MNRKILLFGMIILFIGMNSFGQDRIVPMQSILGIDLDLSLNKSGELIADVDVTVSNSCVEVMLSEKPIFDTNNNTYYIRMDYKQPDLSDLACLQVVTTFHKSYNLGKQLPGIYTVEVAGDAIESIEIPENRSILGIDLDLSLNKSGELIADVDVTVSNSCVEVMLSEKPIFDTNNNTYYIRMDYKQPDLSDLACLQVETTFHKSYNLGKQLPGIYTVEVAGDAIESIEIPENRSILGIDLDLSLNKSGELIADVDVTVSNSCVEVMLSEKPIFDTNNNTYYIRMDYKNPDLSDLACLQVVTTIRKSYNLGKQLPGTYIVEVAGDAIESIKIPENQWLCGDYNEDGIVNIIDALKITSDYVGYVTGNDILGDVDANGVLNIVDALLVARYYVSNDSSLLNCKFTR